MTTLQDAPISADRPYPARRDASMAHGSPRRGIVVAWLKGLMLSAGFHFALAALIVLAAVWFAIPKQFEIAHEITTAVPSPPSMAESSDFRPKPIPETSLEPGNGPFSKEGEHEVSGGLNQLIKRQFQHQSGELAEQTGPVRRQRLEEVAGRLQGMSSESAIRDMAGPILGAFGADARASTPADHPKSEDFDVTSAQIDRVSRIVGEDGTIHYEGILVDSNGRRSKVMLSAEEGEELYRLFETIQRYPLLEQVYRQLAMPILDSMLKESSRRTGTAATGETTERTGALGR